MLESSIYHKVLRISAAVCAVVLLFQGGLVSRSTALLATHTQLFLATSIEATMTPALTVTVDTVPEVVVPTSAADVGANFALQDRTTFILAAALFIIVLLLILNYILDYRRLQRMGGVIVIEAI